MLTPAKKKYIFSIYEISKEKLSVRSVDISRAINISKASVCTMLPVLTDDGLIVKNSDGAIALTEKGEDIAQTLYDIYTALVGFFVNVFKSSQISAREDAIACVCNLTEENTENMKKYLWG